MRLSIRNAIVIVVYVRLCATTVVIVTVVVVVVDVVAVAVAAAAVVTVAGAIGVCYTGATCSSTGNSGRISIVTGETVTITIVVTDSRDTWTGQKADITCTASTATTLIRCRVTRSATRS